MKRSLSVPLYVLLVFLSGVLVGTVGYRLIAAGPVVSAPAPKPNKEEFRKKYIEEMRTRLHMSDDQIAKLKESLNTTDQRFAEFDERMKAERKTIFEEHVQRIRAFLDEQQRTEYEKLRQEREERRHARDKQRGHSGSKPTSP